MTIRYAKHYNTRVTPQSEAIPGKKMIENNAGGYAFQLDKWGHLDRWLILGAEGGTYYVGERKLTKDNAKNVLACIESDGVRVVNRIVEISDSGRAPKNDPALFALAMAAGLGDEKTKAAALEALPKVARIGTHLFHFLEYVQSFRGWGRALRRSIGNWYLEKDAEKVMHQLTKYQSRDGWSHSDALRLAHPMPKNSDYDFLFRYAVKGATEALLNPKGADETLQRYIGAIEKLKELKDGKSAAKVIADFKLPREVIPTELLNDPAVWEALFPHMPMTAMIRNLATMTRIGLITPLSAVEAEIIRRLNDKDLIKKARIHPIAVLAALTTYAQGHGARGQNTWNPVSRINDALDEAFYLAFGNVTPSNKRILLSLDVSGSMGWGEIAGIPGLIPMRASAAMAMITARTEPNYALMAFSHTFIPVDITPKQRLDAIAAKLSALGFGGTDCALPMVWAMQKKIPVDAFVIYTDNETWAGSIHPAQALKQYRDAMGIPAKLIVVGMTATDITIADPNDAGMLDVVGFDTAAPQLMSDFIKE